MAELIMWLFLLLSVLTAISIPFILKLQKRAGDSGNENSTLPKPTSVNLKAVWEIQNVKHGVVLLTGNRYCMVLRLAAADFFLLGEGEQTQVEDALISVLMGLSFPVQFLVTSEAVDTRRAVQDIKGKLYGLHDNVRAYAQDYATYLEGLTSERTAVARSAYAVLSFETDKGLEYARTELMARVSSLADGLGAAKVQCEVLDTPALVDLLQHLLNRGRAWRPSEADTAGVMDMYHISERQVTKSA